MLFVIVLKSGYLNLLDMGKNDIIFIISYKNISDSCRKNKTIYGLHWEFVKKEDK